MGKTLTFIAEDSKSTVLLPPKVTTSVAEAYVKPAAGSLGLNLRAVVAIGEATDVVLTLKTADNATGTGAADFPKAVPLFVDGVRQVNAVTYTVTEDTGNFIVDFCVDPALIPDGKFVGIHQAASNELNLIATTAIENATTAPAV